MFVWHEHNRIMLAGISQQFVLLRCCHPLLANFIYHSCSLARSLYYARKQWCCWLECTVVAVGPCERKYLNDMKLHFEPAWHSKNFHLDFVHCQHFNWDMRETRSLLHPHPSANYHLSLACKVWNKTETKGWRNGTRQKEASERASEGEKRRWKLRRVCIWIICLSFCHCGSCKTYHRMLYFHLKSFHTFTKQHIFYYLARWH